MKTILIFGLLICSIITTDDANVECLDDLKARLQELMNRNTELKSERDELTATNTMLTGVLAGVNADIVECEAITAGLEAQISTLNTDITNLLNQVVGLNNELNSITSAIDSLHSQIDACEATNASITISNTNLSNANTLLTSQIAALTAQLNGLRAELSSCEHRLSCATDRITHLNAEIDALLATNAAAISNLREDIQAAIAIWTQTVTDRQAVLNALLAEIAGLNSTKAGLIAEIAALDARIAELLAAIDACRGCRTLSRHFTLHFQYACRNGVNFNSCKGKVYWNNQVIYQIRPNDYTLHNISVNVDANVGENKLSFEGEGTSDGYGVTIDNVTLNRDDTGANIVVNGNFESNNVNGSWNLFNNINGWNGSNIEVGRGTIYNGAWTSQVVELDGNTNFEMTQTIIFDDRYQVVDPIAPSLVLTFKYACREGVAFESCKGKVYWNNAIVYEIVPTDYRVHDVTVTFNAQWGSNSLSFEGSGNSDSYGVTIDKVTLKKDGVGANLVINGDFQHPNTNGSWSYFNGIQGWTGSNIEVGQGTIYNSRWNSQVAELDSNANSRMTQTFNFAAPNPLNSQPDVLICNRLAALIAERDAKILILNGLNTQISNLTDERDDLLDEISDLHSQIDAINCAINSCQSANNAAQCSINHLNQEIECRNEKITALSLDFNAMIAEINVCN